MSSVPLYTVFNTSAFYFGSGQNLRRKITLSIFFRSVKNARTIQIDGPWVYFDTGSFDAMGARSALFLQDLCQGHFCQRSTGLLSDLINWSSDLDGFNWFDLIWFDRQVWVIWLIDLIDSVDLIWSIDWLIWSILFDLSDLMDLLWFDWSDSVDLIWSIWFDRSGLIDMIRSIWLSATAALFWCR